MHDVTDWPAAFLGALYAGVVPVAVNTLLTADDYAYMLAHSRAQAAIVSAPLLPVLQAAMAKGAHEVRSIIVSRGASLPDGCVDFEAWLGAQPPMPAAADTAPTRSLLAVFVGLHRPAQGHGAHARQPYWTAEFDGKPELGCARTTSASRGEALLRLRAGQRAELPAVGRRDRAADGRAADAGGDLQALDRAPAERVLRRTDRLRRHAGLAALPPKEAVALRLCSSAGEALPREIGERFTAHYGVEIIDGIGSTRCCTSSSPTAPATCATAPPASRCRVPGRDPRRAGQPIVEHGRIGDLYIHGPSSR